MEKEKIERLISNMWLILLYTVQLVIPDICTKFQNPKSSRFCEIFIVREKEKWINKGTNKQSNMWLIGGVMSTRYPLSIHFVIDNARKMAKFNLPKK